MFRVATDKTVLAHPEVQIGFHPAAGASYYLSRLPGYLGEYLALTGQKLDGVEMIACGLATYSLYLSLMKLLPRTKNIPQRIRSNFPECFIFGSATTVFRSKELLMKMVEDQVFGIPTLRNTQIKDGNNGLLLITLIIFIRKMWLCCIRLDSMHTDSQSHGRGSSIRFLGQ